MSVQGNTEYTSGIKILFLTVPYDLSSVEIGITIFIRERVTVSGKAINNFLVHF